MAARMFVRQLQLVSAGNEDRFIIGQKMTCYNNLYPYNIFPDKELRTIDFEPLTIFYGGNGSGKTTLLNILAEKLHIDRASPFNSSAFFAQYVANCEIDARTIPAGSRIITSDDVTDFLLDLRNLNSGIDRRRDELLASYSLKRDASLEFTSLADYDEWKEGFDAKRFSKSHFVNERLARNIRMLSNGETAMRYYTERIGENALYLIDEPENSLSAELQLKLASFLSDAVRFFGCQIVISTHSPFLLAMPNAKIYDLDSCPVVPRKWTELENVRVYYDFFQRHRGEF